MVHTKGAHRWMPYRTFFLGSKKWASNQTPWTSILVHEFAEIAEIILLRLHWKALTTGTPLGAYRASPDPQYGGEEGCPPTWPWSPTLAWSSTSAVGPLALDGPLSLRHFLKKSVSALDPAMYQRYSGQRHKYFCRYWHCFSLISIPCFSKDSFCIFIPWTGPVNILTNRNESFENIQKITCKKKVWLHWLQDSRTNISERIGYVKKIFSLIWRGLFSLLFDREK